MKPEKEQGPINASLDQHSFDLITNCFKILLHYIISNLVKSEVILFSSGVGGSDSEMKADLVKAEPQTGNLLILALPM